MSANNQVTTSLVIAELGEEIRYDRALNFKKNIENHLKKQGSKPDEVMIIDKKGKSYSLNDRIDPDNNRFFIFQMKFSEEILVSNLEKNLGIIVSQFSLNYIPSFISKLVVCNAKELVIDNPELRILNDRIHDSLDILKDQFRKFKIQLKLGEKLKDNLNFQSKAMSVLYNNIQELNE